MTTAKLIVAYPQPTDTQVFEKTYQEEHVPLAIDKLNGITKIVATRTLASPQDTPPYYRIAEVHKPSTTQRRNAVVTRRFGRSKPEQGFLA